MNRKMFATFVAGFIAGVMAMVFLADIFVNGSSWLRLPRAQPARQVTPAPQKKEDFEYGLIVPLADLDLKARIGGRLGYPVGHVVTIRGEWIEPLGRVKNIADLPIFRVDSVNGRALEEPVEFTRSSIRGFMDSEQHIPVAGDTWEIRGAELGGYVGLPPELAADSSRDPAQKFKTPFGFSTYFHCSRVRVIQPE